MLTEALLKPFEKPLGALDATLYLNYISEVDVSIIISLLKQLAKYDVDLANQNLTEVMEASLVIGLKKQMKILNACYDIVALENTVTTHIALLFSTERLALSFLNEAQKNKFYKQIEKLIQLNHTEVNKKGLLKNLADESSNESKELLMRILLSHKKTELDVLCLRLLKKTTSKTVYLETCNKLLSSEKENLFKSIIRTLSFAYYFKAIPTFIKLLSHKKFSKDAYQGLFVMGEKAIPLLTKEVNKARPDKRHILNELLKEIESKTVFYEEDL